MLYYSFFSLVSLQLLNKCRFDVVVWFQFTCISFVRLISCTDFAFEKVYKTLLPMKKHFDTVKGNLVSPVRKMWLPLLLCFCLSWVFLLHVQIKLLLQILEDLHLFGESFFSIYVPEAIFLGLPNRCFPFLLSILGREFRFIKGLFSCRLYLVDLVF